MSLLWIEGFEGFGTSTGVAPQPAGVLGRKYQVNNESAMDIEDGRLGGYSLELLSYNQWFRTPVINNHVTIISGFAFHCTLFESESYSFYRLYDGETLGMALRFTDGGEIIILRGSTVLETTSGLNLVAGNWYWCEFKVVVDDSTGSYELKIGGATVASASGVDTQIGSNAYYGSARFSGMIGPVLRVDDWYVCNGAGSVNNDFLGNVRVSAIFPAGAGNSTQWTPSAGSNYQCVDENPGNDDTDYVETDTSSNKDLYDYDSLGSTDDIKGLQINTDCRETDATSFSIITPIRSGGADYDDSAQNIGSTDYVTRVRVAELDPDTSALWTYTGINNAEFGIKVG